MHYNCTTMLLYIVQYIYYYSLYIRLTNRNYMVYIIIIIIIIVL